MNEQSMIMDLLLKGFSLAELQRKTGIPQSSLSFVRDGKRSGFMYKHGKRLEKLHREVCGHANAD